MELDPRVCNCKCHADGHEDHSECCWYVAACERDKFAEDLELAIEILEMVWGVWSSEKILGESLMLYLVRHGETAMNKNHQLRGWADPPLDESGIAAAHKTADKIQSALSDAPKKPVLVVTSDLQRAMKTGKIIADRLHGMFSSTKDVRPWNIGELSGMDSRKGEKILREMKAQGKAPKGGETYEAFARRWESALKQLKSISKDRHLIVVTHFRNVCHSTGGLCIEPGKFVKLPK